MTTIHDVMRRANAARLRADRYDQARDELEATPGLLERLANTWWCELEPDRLFAAEYRMLRAAFGAFRNVNVNDPDDEADLADFARAWRRTMFLESSDCQTAIEDRADGEDWPT